MNILCIKHIDFEGPGAIALWAQQNGHPLEMASIYQNHPLPAPNTFDALVVMGGPMNVYEDVKYPWLAKEKRYIRSAIGSGKPVLGVCLGAQLIAHALGAKVTPGAHQEIGWFPIRRSADCPAEWSLPDSLQACHWHGDTFAIPTGARLIAESDACQNQGFLYRTHILGLQCHLEMTREGLALLATACQDELVDGRYIQSRERLQSEPDETFKQMHAALFRILDEWSTH